MKHCELSRYSLRLRQCETLVTSKVPKRARVPRDTYASERNLSTGLAKVKPSRPPKATMITNIKQNKKPCKRPSRRLVSNRLHLSSSWRNRSTKMKPYRLPKREFVPEIREDKSFDYPLMVAFFMLPLWDLCPAAFAQSALARIFASLLVAVVNILL